MSQLKVDSIVPTTGAPTGGAGGIIQSIMSTNTTATGSVTCNNSSNYFDIPNMNVTITPRSATGKIMVNFSVFGEPSVDDHRVGFRIKRAISGGNTNFIQGEEAGSCSRYCVMPAIGYISSDKNSTPSFASFGPYIDTPFTTSAVTYTVQVRFHEDSSGTWYYNRVVNSGTTADMERGVSHITVAEVSG